MKNKIYENELTATIPTASAKYTMSSSHLVLSQLLMQPDPTVGIREDIEPAQVLKETFQNVHSIKYIKNENINSTTDIPAGSVINKKTNRMKQSVRQTASKQVEQINNALYSLQPTHPMQDETDDFYRALHEQKMQAVELMRKNQNKIIDEQVEAQKQLDEMKKKYAKFEYTYDYNGKILITNQNKNKFVATSCQAEVRVLKKKPNGLHSAKLEDCIKIENPNAKLQLQSIDKTTYEEARMVSGPIRAKYKYEKLAGDMSNLQKVKLLMNDKQLKLSRKEFDEFQKATIMVSKERAYINERQMTSYQSQSKSIQAQSPYILTKQTSSKKESEDIPVNVRNISQGDIKLAKDSDLMQSLLITNNEEDINYMMQESKTYKLAQLNTQESELNIPQLQQLLFTGNGQLPSLASRRYQLSNKQRKLSPRVKKSQKQLDSSMQMVKPNQQMKLRSISQHYD